MAYETGTVQDSHELVENIKAFLEGIGWSTIATLKEDLVGDGYDFVFYSGGVDESSDIYVRIAAGEYDKQVSPHGDIQHPHSDGFTEYVNVFAYQHFPTGGTSPDEGSNEIGLYGPILYVAEDTDASPGHLNEYNLSKSTATVPRYREVAEFNGNVYPLTSTFDGKRLVYQYSSDSTKMDRVDLHDGSVTTKNRSNNSSGYPASTPYIRLEDGTERIYQTSYSVTAGEALQKYDIAADTWTYSGLPDPPWGTARYTCSCVGPRRLKTSANYFMYVFRGGNTDDTSSVKWARFDLNNETWSSEMSPDAPWGVGGMSGSYHPFCLFVTKEQSGYEHDRIYLWRGNSQTNFASIAIGDDGDVAPGEVWALHAATTFYQAQPSSFCVGKTIFSTGGYGEYKSLYRFELPDEPTLNGSWETLYDAWLQYNSDTMPILFHPHYHLGGRVRVDEFVTNTYWLFGDEDHLVMVVKNNRGEYEYAYVGKFVPYANPLVTSLLDRVPGGATSIRVDDPSILDVGRKYTIVDTTGENSAVVTNSLTGVEKRLSASETFTVLENDGSGNVIISALHSDYWPGSKIGEDPVPVMVRTHGIEKAQTFDTVDLVDVDGYSDSSWQYYTLMPSVSDVIANATDLSERSLETYVFSIVLINEGDTYKGREVRGQLKGVFSCGTAVASETEINLGSKTYIVFDIADSSHTQFIVVGPTE